MEHSPRSGAVRPTAVRMTTRGVKRGRGGLELVPPLNSRFSGLSSPNRLNPRIRPAAADAAGRFFFPAPSGALGGCISP